MSYLALVVGAAVGSFLNVCISRLPRGESVVRPGSHCESCGRPLGPFELIPILSYIALGGRCASCRARISVRHPLVEAACAVLFFQAARLYGCSVRTVLLSGFASMMVALGVTDLETMTLPDRLTLPLAAVGVASQLLPGNGARVGLVGSLVGLAVGGGVTVAIALASRGGMGGGDVKLLAGVGAFLGWQACLVALFGGACLGAVTGIALIAAGRKGRKDALPFGTFVCAVSVLLAYMPEPVRLL